MTRKVQRGNAVGKRLTTAASMLAVMAVAGCCPHRHDGARPEAERGVKYAAIAPALPAAVKLTGYKDPTIINVVFEKGCARGVALADGQVCDPAHPDNKKNCARVKGGHSLLFQATDEGGLPLKSDFVLDFDLSGKTKIPSAGGVTPKLATKSTDPQTNANKAHSFDIETVNPPPGCKRVDPQIILD